MFEKNPISTALSPHTGKFSPQKTRFFAPDSRYTIQAPLSQHIYYTISNPHKDYKNVNLFSFFVCTAAGPQMITTKWQADCFMP